MSGERRKLFNDFINFSTKRGETLLESYKNSTEEQDKKVLSLLGAQQISEELQNALENPKTHEFAVSRPGQSKKVMAGFVRSENSLDVTMVSTATFQAALLITELQNKASLLDRLAKSAMSKRVEIL